MNDSIKRTLLVTLSVCLICSLFVSITAVSLRSTQETNKLNDQRIKILEAAKIYDPTTSIEDQFDNLEIKFLDFETGSISSEFQSFDIDKYDQIKALRFAELSSPVPQSEDIAIIKNRENVGKVYLVMQNDNISKIVLPIRGYGLWGTLYGYIAIENDLNTVVGIEFYEHKETPGLGGEVDNPSWKNSWAGKQIYNNNDEVYLSVLKGVVPKDDPEFIYKIDGLSGATLTSNGITNMIKYWFGESGYSKFLANLNNES